MTTKRMLVPVIGLVLGAWLVADAGEAWARARSGGSRGSRSFSAPSRSVPSSPAAPAAPSSPGRSAAAPATTPPPSRGLFGGLMGGIAGFALGGLLGGLLFGGFGHGMGMGGFGLMDLVLVAGLGYLAWTFFRRRQSPAEPAYAGAGGGRSASYEASWPAPGGASSGPGGAGTAVAEPPVAEAPLGVATDLGTGLAHIRQMDPGFAPDAFLETAQAAFRRVQGAVGLRDVTPICDELMPDLYAELTRQCGELTASRRSNRIEQIEIQRAELSDAWQERGQDFLTVSFRVSMLDYSVDARTGAVVDGSRTQPVTVEEQWTFSRPVGSQRWKLSAIQPA